MNVQCKLERQDTKQVGVLRVTELMRRGRLRWFDHLERKDVDDWVSACRDMEVTGDRRRGRGRKTWGSVDGDMRLLCLRREWAQDRVRWRSLISGNRPTRASMETQTLNR